MLKSIATPHRAKIHCHTSPCQNPLPHLTVPKSIATPHRAKIHCHASPCKNPLPHLTVPKSIATPHRAKIHCHTSPCQNPLPHLTVPKSIATPHRAKIQCHASPCQNPLPHLKQQGLLLLLLRSPAISLGFTIWGEIFAYVTVFNPTIEVVTFRLRGWCMLGVFLLPAFTRLGYECQDLLSLCDGVHVCRD